MLTFHAEKKSWDPAGLISALIYDMTFGPKYDIMSLLEARFSSVVTVICFIINLYEYFTGMHEFM